MATIGMHFGHDAGVALTDAGGYRVIEAERRLGFRHVCGSNGDFPRESAAWLAELRARAASPVTRIAVADWYTPAARYCPRRWSNSSARTPAGRPPGAPASRTP